MNLPPPEIIRELILTDEEKEKIKETIDKYNKLIKRIASQVGWGEYHHMRYDGTYELRKIPKDER